MNPNDNLRRQEWLLVHASVNANIGGGRTTQTQELLADLRQSLFDDIANSGIQPTWEAAPLTAAYYGVKESK